MQMNTVIQGDCLEILKTLPDESIDCCVTSPPYYGLRDYGTGNKQIGLEETPEEYIEKLVKVFREVKRCLKDDGTLWVNIGDSYAGSGSDGEAKQKDLIGIPWMLAFALRNDGWYLRQDIIWHKPNPMPESVKDRCTKSHEYIFLLSKKPHYYFDYEEIQEDCVSKDVSESIRFGGNKYGNNEDSHYAIYSGNVWKPTSKRNKRDVWSVTTKSIKEAHFATYPEELVKPCILAGCRVGGVVLDPFFGSGTTGRVAASLGRNYVGIELNPDYIEISDKRTHSVQMSIEAFT